MWNPIKQPFQRVSDLFKPRPRMYGYWGLYPVTMPVSYYATAPPSSVQDLAEFVTNGNRSNFAPSTYVDALKTAYAEEKNKKAIMEVLSRRLTEGWPYCYKALDALASIGTTIDDLLTVHDKLKDLAKTDKEGHEHIKESVKPLLEKCDKEKAKREEKAAYDAQAQIWANFSVYNPQAAYGPWGYHSPPQITWGQPWSGPPPVWQPSVYYPTYRPY